ncbi:MAG: type II secretion system F family protein [Ralstonia sp.]|jgi:tight adherence protein B|uniref:Type II secretion system F family protein n=5 Tax=Pseudomonadota TaxID=1224 RepID=A0A2P4RI57_RALPI|nr:MULTISPECIES: type II secretion system F family protein [Ralstonia]MBA4199731.1 pilus assembly protein TadB [Ralstonia sp.]MBA4231126.1 pilus assembly protein TadB [Ralstonia sp.]MBA4235599.1 pilus assembly protein TadB [Ralstonia sp.]MBA4279947.1 pilus assembly protein TadB [Ralstonia sp.]MBA4296632.1 pilus assembly protein TadB [Ralstonia sp.]
MDPLVIGFALSVFIAMMLAVLAVYLWWDTRHSSAARRFSHRLKMALASSVSHGGTDSILKQRMLSESPEVAAMLGRLPRIQTLDRRLLQSGLDWSVSRFFALTLMVPAMIAIVFSLFDPPPMTLLVFVLAGASLPALYVMHRRTRRLLKLEAQLPEATDLISRALRAGHSLPAALEMAGTELPAPIGAELAIVFSQINFGVSMSDAFAGLTDRVPVDDLRYLVIAILIQRESGGNLAEILDNVGKLIRKRLQLLDKVRVLSAEGRLGGWILTLLPPVMGLAIYLLNPELMSTLWTTDAGIRLLWFAITMTCLGMLWIRQIVRIHI